MQELQQVVDHSFLTDLDLVRLLEERGIREGFKAFFSTLHVVGIGEELGEAKDSFLLLKIILHVENYIGEDRERLTLEFSELRDRPPCHCV